MLKELDCVSLTVDLPEHGFKKDQRGTVVLIHQTGSSYEVEFISPEGDTIAVLTLHDSQLRHATA